LIDWFAAVDFFFLPLWDNVLDDVVMMLSAALDDQSFNPRFRRKTFLQNPIWSFESFGLMLQYHAWSLLWTILHFCEIFFFLSPSHQFMNQVLHYQLKLSSHFYPSINVVVWFEELFFAILFGHDFVLFSV
jgi:hypothetical protein